MGRAQNSQRVKTIFNQKLVEIGYDGVVGAAAFEKVHDGLNPVQKSRLMDLCGEQFQNGQECITTDTAVMAMI